MYLPLAWCGSRPREDQGIRRDRPDELNLIMTSKLFRVDGAVISSLEPKLKQWNDLGVLHPSTEVGAGVLPEALSRAPTWGPSSGS